MEQSPYASMGSLRRISGSASMEGKAVEWGAETNPELLDQLIGMDEGSAYLGECALVPWDSPINRSGVLFYNTLIDENAACHLALGKGYINTIQGYHDRTLENAMTSESRFHRFMRLQSRAGHGGGCCLYRRAERTDLP